MKKPATKSDEPQVKKAEDKPKTPVKTETNDLVVPPITNNPPKPKIPDMFASAKKEVKEEKKILTKRKRIEDEDDEDEERDDDDDDDIVVKKDTKKRKGDVDSEDEDSDNEIEDDSDEEQNGLKSSPSKSEKKITPSYVQSIILTFYRFTYNKFDLEKIASWKKDEPVPYNFLANTLFSISETSSRNKITEILCNAFRAILTLTPQDLVPAVYLTANRVCLFSSY